jgi:hypothetical protein
MNLLPLLCADLLDHVFLLLALQQTMAFCQLVAFLMQSPTLLLLLNASVSPILLRAPLYTGWKTTL